MKPILVTVPVTGEVSFNYKRMRGEFRADFEAGYCLDAPDTIATGQTLHVESRVFGRVMAQSDFKHRPGTFGRG